MKMDRLVICCMVAALGLAQCGPSDKVRERGAKDIENAIEVIEGRREAEMSIIKGHEREILQLEENLEHVRSDGMRKKIQSEINLKRIGIQKAIQNMANQDTILTQLKLKRDSLNAQE